MSLEMLEKFFLWCLLVNTAVYAVTALATIAMRGFLYRVHRKLFNMEPQAVDNTTQSYLSNFKLLITVFNFAPWVALLILK